MQLRTIRNYKLSEVSSAMQKAVRRAETPLAGYWALELWASGFGNYVWKRLLTTSAEDCWGIITQEIKALHDSYRSVNEGIPARQARGRIFISKDSHGNTDGRAAWSSGGLRLNEKTMQFTGAARSPASSGGLRLNEIRPRKGRSGGNVMRFVRGLPA